MAQQTRYWKSAEELIMMFHEIRVASGDTEFNRWLEKGTRFNFKGMPVKGVWIECVGDDPDEDGWKPPVKIPDVQPKPTQPVLRQSDFQTVIDNLQKLKDKLPE